MYTKLKYTHKDRESWRPAEGGGRGLLMRMMMTKTGSRPRLAR